MVTFLWRSEDEPDVSSSTGFCYVYYADYYYDPVCWAVANGVTQGVSATQFGPGQPCTRCPIVTFLYRALA